MDKKADSGGFIMNKAFIETLYKNLLVDVDYSPITDENGEIHYGNEIKILVKKRAGGFALLELIDGDVLTAEAIERHFQETKGKLENPDSFEINYIAQIYVFSAEPDPTKTDLIDSNQINEVSDRRLLECMSVNIDKKELKKYLKSPSEILGLDKTIETMFQSGIYNNVSYEEIKETIRIRQEEYKIEFKAKKPNITFGIIAINILVWIAANIYSLKTGINVDELQIRLGAKINYNILTGEYWRFVTPVFFHFGIMHLALNSYSLYVVGVTVERIYGHVKFIAIYFIAGIFGSIMSFMFSQTSSAGASGAIFGLLGSILYFGLEKPKVFRKYFGTSILSVLVINLVYGFSNSGIDNFGHIGGLIGGFLAAGAVKATMNTSPRWYLNRALYIVLTVALAFGGIFYGFNNRHSNILRTERVLEQYAKASDWAKVEETAEKILFQKPDKNIAVNVYWRLIHAEVNINKMGEALEHAQELREIEPKLGYYLLGAIYFEMGQYDVSKQQLLRAKDQSSEYTIDAAIDEVIDGMIKAIDLAK